MPTVAKVIGVVALCMAGGCIALVGLVSVVGVKASKEYQSKTAPENQIITLAEFSQLANGMAYEQVTEVIGEHGVMMSENTLPDGLGGEFHTVMYQWQNPNFTNASATFQNGRLISKAQFGLK